MAETATANRADVSTIEGLRRFFELPAFWLGMFLSVLLTELVAFDSFAGLVGGISLLVYIITSAERQGILDADYERRF